MTYSDLKIENSGEGVAAKAMTGNAVRYGIALPFAATVTVALTLSMAALIASEFTPQDKAEIASFEINPRVDPVPIAVRTEAPDPLKEVEVPPAMPKIETVKTASVDLPTIEVKGKKTDFTMDRLVFGKDIDIVPIDKNPTPQLRIPPVFPNRFLQGNVSGYCRVRFDIGANGQPLNVKTTTCTNAQLKSPTVKSVQKWKYAPEIRDGRPVSRSGLETTIRFDLRDERGQVLPLPSGY